MKFQKIKWMLILSVLVMLLAIPNIASASNGDMGRGEPGVIYVSSQGLYYDTYTTADPLPMRGNFQKLEVTADGPVTEFGPGDPGYLGGRWWVDTNGDNMQDEGDHYFLCPLLGPGRESP